MKYRTVKQIVCVVGTTVSILALRAVSVYRIQPIVAWGIVLATVILTFDAWWYCDIRELEHFEPDLRTKYMYYVANIRPYISVFLRYLGDRKRAKNRKRL